MSENYFSHSYQINNKTMIKKFTHNTTTFMLIIDSIPEMTKDREIVYFEHTQKSVHHNKVKEIQCPAGHIYQPDDVLFLADRIRDIESKVIIKEIDIDF